MSALLPAIGVTLMGFGAGAATLYEPPELGEMAVVFAPGVDEVAIFSAIRAAGGRYAGSTRIGQVAVAYAEDSGFAARIRSMGAIFVFSASALCGTSY